MIVLWGPELRKPEGSGPELGIGSEYRLGEALRFTSSTVVHCTPHETETTVLHLSQHHLLLCNSQNNGRIFCIQKASQRKITEVLEDN